MNSRGFAGKGAPGQGSPTAWVGRLQMSKRKWLFGVAALALIAIAVLIRSQWTTDSARSQPRAERMVPVETALAERKKVPVRLDALGSAIEAQIAQTQGAIARDQAQLDGALRDVARYTDLVAKGATPTVNLDNAKTQAQVFRAAIKSDQGLLENLKVQLGYCTVRAPITGRISAANVKVGNFVRQADTQPMAVIIQMAPVYVSFTVPQKNLPDSRKAIAAKSASIEAVVPGEDKRAQGAVTMIENTVDQATGMATVRATMPNTDELLWPGTLVTAQMTLRSEEAVVVPASAVQVSQTSNFVFVVVNGAAKVQPVKIERQVGQETVIASGLNGGETVVTEGQLLLSNGTRVDTRARKAPVPAS